MYRGSSGVYSQANIDPPIPVSVIAGVASLNTLTGVLAITPGPGIGVGTSGSNIVISNTGVTDLNGLTGSASLVAGSNITITPSGNTLIIASTGGGGGNVIGSGTVPQIAVWDGLGQLYGNNRFTWDNTTGTFLVTDNSSNPLLFIEPTGTISIGHNMANGEFISITSTNVTTYVQDFYINNQFGGINNVFHTKADPTNIIAEMGDLGGAGNGVKFRVLDAAQALVGVVNGPFVIEDTSFNQVINASASSFNTSIGDLSFFQNKSRLDIADGTRSLTFSVNNNNGLLIDVANKLYGFGDLAGVAGLSKAVLNDTSGIFNIHAGLALSSIQTINDADYTALNFDAIIEYTGILTAPHILNLPTVSSNSGKIFIIKDSTYMVQNFPVNIIPFGGETIEGQPNLPLNRNGETLIIYTDSIEWKVMSISSPLNGYPYILDTDNNFFAVTVQPTFTPGVGVNNIFAGQQAGMSNTTGSGNLFYGYQAGMNNISASNSICIGYQAGLNNDGQNNLFFGFQAGLNNTTGNYNLFIGSNSGQSNIAGYNNFGVGNGTGFNMVGGFGNTYVGIACGATNVGNINQTFVGSFAGYNSQGNENTYVGASCGGSSTTGALNTMMGAFCGVSVIGGGENCYYGWGAGANNVNGSTNVVIGYNACNNGTTDANFGNTIIIGDRGVTNNFSSSIGIGSSVNITSANQLLFGSASHPIYFVSLGDFTNQQNNTYLEVDDLSLAINLRSNGNTFFSIDGTNGGASIPSGLYLNPNTIAADTNLLLQTSDCVVNMNPVTTTVTATLPATPPHGMTVMIRDGAGNAAVQNITVAGNGNTINGIASKLITTNYGSITLVYDNGNTDWGIF